MAITATYGTLTASEHSRQLRKAVVASTIGTAIEWYDFFLYGTAAGLVFGKLYFPNEDALTRRSPPSVPISSVSSGDQSAPRYSATMEIVLAAKQRSSPRFCVWASRPSS